MNEPLPWQVGSGKPKPTEAQLEQEGADFLNFMQQHSKNAGGR